MLTSPNLLHLFRPISTTGTTGISFLSELHRGLTGLGDPLKTTHLFQQASLAVQRYYSVPFSQTFSVPIEFNQRHSS